MHEKLKKVLDSEFSKGEFAASRAMPLYIGAWFTGFCDGMSGNHDEAQLESDPSDLALSIAADMGFSMGNTLRDTYEDEGRTPPTSEVMGIEADDLYTLMRNLTAAILGALPIYTDGLEKAFDGAIIVTDAELITKDEADKTDG